MADSKAFTGRTRRRQTSKLVKWVDGIARGLITVGGIGTIGAVLLVCFFLVYEVWPLFRPTVVDEPVVSQPTWKALPPVRAGMDEYRVLGWDLLPDGKLQVFRLSDGSLVKELKPFKDSELAVEGQTLTAWSFSGGKNEAAFGFADGTVRLGLIGFETTYLDLKDAPPELKDLELGEVAQYKSGVVGRISESQLRSQQFVTSLETPAQGSGSPIVLIDYARRSSGPIFCALSADGNIKVSSVRERKNILTGEVTLTARGADLPLPEEIKEKASYLLISGLGDSVFVAWKDGRLIRYDTRDLQKPYKAEELDLVPEPGETLNALEFLIGRGTLIAGDSLGRVNAWFTVRRAGAKSEDGMTLVNAHQLSDQDSPVTSVSASPRSRIAAAGFEDGRVQLLHVTSEKLMATMSAGDVPVHGLAIAPKNNAVLAITPNGVTSWAFDAAHPEATLKTLFRPLWYEGSPQPAYAWQSSSGVDAFEPKYGLMPLVFGTLKATTYSMLFGVPLALLAALYTSEFLHPRLKTRIKPTIEMMASLPSVVLGFLAGLVIAPVVENIVPQVLTAFFTLPLAFLTGAYLWQLLPPTTSIRYASWRFLIILLLGLPAGVAVGWLLGPLVERVLFAGNIKAWLDGQVGSGVGGWMLLLIPLSAVATAYAMARTVNPWLREISKPWTRTQGALADLAKFVAGVLATLTVALVISLLLSAVHLDPRGSYVDTYVQRNAMVVGFIMGFAIIPIIYTIADDALSTVPEHLRSASLGAGATPWQTAMRIVIPTAMSGLFSAVMIGLGRAVGETMIVLMAAGNTPVMDWNIFNGFQTLSASIATELPEASAGDTHYRVLFLAALTLFVITFLVNTVAEIIRQRFRRRAYEL